MSQLIVLGLMVIVFVMLAGKETLGSFRQVLRGNSNPRRPKTLGLRKSFVRAFFLNRSPTILSGIVVAGLFAWVLLPERPPEGSIDNLREAERAAIGQWIWSTDVGPLGRLMFRFWVHEDGSCDLDTRLSDSRSRWSPAEYYGTVSAWKIGSSTYVDTGARYYYVDAGECTIDFVFIDANRLQAIDGEGGTYVAKRRLENQ